jgi:hypothetical protein
MKTCNAFALHVFMQLGCKNLQVSLGETCTHLVQATCIARDCRRAPPHKESLKHTPTKNDNHNTLHKNIPKTQSTHPSNIPRTKEITRKVGRRRRGAGGAGDERQRQRADVTVTRPAAAAQEAKEGPTPAAGEETKASWRP